MGFLDIDWQDFIADHRTDIDQMRGISPAPHTKETTMSRYKDSDLLEWIRTEWCRLTRAQQRAAVRCRYETKDKLRIQKIMEYMDRHQTLTVAQVADEEDAVRRRLAAAPVEKTATPRAPEDQDDTQIARPEETGPVMPDGAALAEWEPGRVFTVLPDDLRECRRKADVTDEVARTAREQRGRWVLLRIQDATGMDPKDRKLQWRRTRAVVSEVNRGKPRAFHPRGSFDAQAREIAEYVYAVFCRYKGTGETDHAHA